jgi:hypothetical protein
MLSPRTCKCLNVEFIEKVLNRTWNDFSTQRASKERNIVRNATFFFLCIVDEWMTTVKKKRGLSLERKNCSSWKVTHSMT